MKLFGDYERTHSTRALYSDRRFDFLEKSAWPECARMRDVIEQWYGNYPAPHQFELSARLRAEGRSFEAAIFELCLHECLLRLGCAVDVHPDLDGVSTHPEFLVQPADGPEFVLEAALATNQSKKQAGADAILDKLFDELDRIVVSNDFFVCVSVRGKPAKQPSANRIADFLHEKLVGLDPDVLTENYLRNGHAALPEWEYEVDDVCTLRFFPIARKPDVRHLPNKRPIGARSMGAQWADDVSPVRSKIIDKASRYGAIDRSFVVAINLMSESGAGSDDVAEALYGSGGVWQHDRRKQLSAVLTTDCLLPVSVPRCSPRLYHNPSATLPAPDVLTTLPHAFKRATEVEYVAGRSLGDILGLKPTWPYEPGDEQHARDRD